MTLCMLTISKYKSLVKKKKEKNNDVNVLDYINFHYIVQCFFFGDQFEFEMHQITLGEMFYIVNGICSVLLKKLCTLPFCLG